MRSSNAEEASYTGDAWEIFTQLIILVVEGRTPGGEKGYHAGPHCPQPHQSMGNRHTCEPTTSVCVRAESLLKQLRLMWGVGVGVSVEVLLAPDCAHGVNIASTLDTSSAPSPNLQLIEQWNFTVYDKRMPAATSTGWSLVAAVRSFLHFSQLSAWLSSSGGSRPPNVFYRLTVSSPVFCSKFLSEPEQHHFPVANVGASTSIKVVARSLPRKEQIPLIKCLQDHSLLTDVELNNKDGQQMNEKPIDEGVRAVSCNAVSDNQNQPMAQALFKPHQAPSFKDHEEFAPEEDLRRCMMKAKLTETSRVSRSESPDTQLGESLLDPPNSIFRLARRFQSPSRSGSPSLETPEHLICKVRQPGPSHNRPPDTNPFLSPVIFPDASHTINPFAWTQTRYPTPQQYNYHNAAPTKVLQPIHLDMIRPTNPIQYSSFDQPKPNCFFNGTPSFYPVQFNPQYYWRNLGAHPNDKLENVEYYSSFTNSCLPDKFIDGPVARDSFASNSNPLPSSAPRTPSTEASISNINYEQLNASSLKVKAESQGTKRKVVDRLESPNKRESPPHISKSLIKEIPKDLSSPIIKNIDQSPCKNLGKLLSPSLEDLSVICDKAQQKKLLRKGKLKTSFELTPKETREVLSVLRHSVHGMSPKIQEKSCVKMNEKTIIKDTNNFIAKKKIDLDKELGNQKTMLRATRSFSGSVRDSEPELVPSQSSNNACDTSINIPTKNDKNDCHYKSNVCQPNISCSYDTFLHNAKNLTKCVEAKTVTEKTNCYTVSSEPALAKTSAERTIGIGKPSMLTGLKRSSPLSFENEKHDQGEPSKVHRYLDFADVKHEQKTVSKDIISSEKPIKYLSKEPEGANNLLRRLFTSHCLPSANDIPSSQLNNNNLNEAYAKLKRKEDEQQRERESGASTPDIDEEVNLICQRKGLPIPTSSDQVQFRRSLESAANLVFHNKTGLPLTSSPAPMRKGRSFDYDSSLISVAAIKSALRPCQRDEDTEEIVDKNENVLTSPEKLSYKLSSSAPATVTCSNLLGSFEESVLNGRLEPFSTVHGFKAEIAAAGSFCPKHITKPVTVFFYTLCNNHTMSSPYMGHVNLSKKGYHVPSQGTVQVTLFNPHGTVVKMFVVMYDLSDMPPNSKTFLRQRTLNMPVGEDHTHPDAHQWLRYLIHLRFASSKSGKIYLHTDIRIMIFRRCDVDAAVLHQTDTPYEVRSFTHGPSNPKFSPRK